MQQAACELFVTPTSELGNLNKDLRITYLVLFENM